MSSDKPDIFERVIELYREHDGRPDIVFVGREEHRTLLSTPNMVHTNQPRSPSPVSQIAGMDCVVVNTKSMLEVIDTNRYPTVGDHQDPEYPSDLLMMPLK